MLKKDGIFFFYFEPKDGKIINEKDDYIVWFLIRRKHHCTRIPLFTYFWAISVQSIDLQVQNTQSGITMQIIINRKVYMIVVKGDEEHFVRVYILNSLGKEFS